MLKSIWFLLIMIVGLTTLGQEPFVQAIKGLPTEEVYDVFPDSKGFIWVGHSLGLSRYDGRSFRHFTSNEQTGLGVSRLCEDKQGRIWCHNFNGQIFYIENEQMHLLSDYDPSMEINFPDIAVLDSEFIATSQRGLFVYNTFTKKTRYINTPGRKTGSQTLCIYKGSLIIYDNPSARLYRYEKKGGLKELIINNSILGVQKNSRALLLSFATKSGILYGYDNERAEVFSLIIKEDTCHILSISKAPGVINTIVNCNDTIWVNTKQKTYALGIGDTVYGKNITDIVKDQFGNQWTGSLQTGLQLKPRHRGWQNEPITYLEKDDFIRCMITWKNHLIYGTQGGKIILVKNGKPTMTLFLPPRAGSVENFFILPNNQVVVAPSLGLYLADIEKKKLYAISEIATVKTIAITDTTMLIGYAQTLAKISLYPELKEKLMRPDKKNDFESLFKKAIKQDEKYLIDTRCFYVNYNKKNEETYALFKTGLARIVKDSIIPIQFNNKPIRSVSLIQAKRDDIYIGTLSSGLLIKVGDHFDQITTENGLSSNTILKMKLFRDQLVLIEPGYLQIWNIVTNNFTSTIPLPSENAGTVYDFLLENNKVYLNFSNSLYFLQVDNLLSNPPKAFILSATSARNNIEIKNGDELAYNDNSVQFQLASPGYINPEATYFVYRLSGSGDDNTYRLIAPYWLSFISLKPGKYYLWAHAVNFQGLSSSNLLFMFTINKSIWQQGWFLVISIFAGIAILFFLFRWWSEIVRRRNNLLIERITLQTELRKSLLKTIVTQMNPHFIFNAMNTIQAYVYQGDKQNVSNYMGKFSELIRKILDTSNKDSVSLGEEIEIIRLYLDLEKARFEDNFTTYLQVDEDVDTENSYVPPMFIQPYVENAIKHGLFHKKGSRHLAVYVSYDGDTKDFIRITVDDNGIGRIKSMEINHLSGRTHKSFATSALESRVDLINQAMERKINIVTIDKADEEGTTVIIRLPILNEII